LPKKIIKDRNSFDRTGMTATRPEGLSDSPPHNAWKVFIRYCAEIQHGEIERLNIQDGLPVLAEVITRKVKFSP
jgi:hypothetical protein